MARNARIAEIGIAISAIAILAILANPDFCDSLKSGKGLAKKWNLPFTTSLLATGFPIFCEVSLLFEPFRFQIFRAI
jgi:hypothetical protein